ncbi:hypothetical protein ACWC09_06260 [Streptomyces sp. NPDC001617]
MRAAHSCTLVLGGENAAAFSTSSASRWITSATEPPTTETFGTTQICTRCALSTSTTAAHSTSAGGIGAGYT